MIDCVMSPPMSKYKILKLVRSHVCSYIKSLDKIRIIVAKWYSSDTSGKSRSLFVQFHDSFSYCMSHEWDFENDWTYI